MSDTTDPRTTRIIADWDERHLRIAVSGVPAMPNRANRTFQPVQLHVSWKRLRGDTVWRVEEFVIIGPYLDDDGDPSSAGEGVMRYRSPSEAPAWAKGALALYHPQRMK